MTPFVKTDAFKYGIIDKDGKPIRKISSLKTTKEQDSYSMLHRLVFRLKRMIAVLPGGKTTLASYAAAYMLVKENLDLVNEENVEELYADLLNSIEDGYTEPPPELYEAVQRVLDEDGEVANTTSSIDISTPRVYNKTRGRKVRVRKANSQTIGIIKKTPKAINEDLVIDYKGDLICEDDAPQAPPLSTCERPT